MPYKHWKTPKLEAELSAVKKLKGWSTPQHYPRADKGQLNLDRSRYAKTEREIDSILKKRKK